MKRNNFIELTEGELKNLVKESVRILVNESRLINRTVRRTLREMNGGFDELVADYMTDGGIPDFRRFIDDLTSTTKFDEFIVHGKDKAIKQFTMWLMKNRGYGYLKPFNAISEWILSRGERGLSSGSSPEELFDRGRKITRFIRKKGL